MKCEMCNENNAERNGIFCGIYKVCGECVQKSVHARMWLLGKAKDIETDYLYGVDYEVVSDDATD
jgi:hypothetical protein